MAVYARTEEGKPYGPYEVRDDEIEVRMVED